MQDVQEEIDAELNSFTTVVDAMKCRLYRNNFGEFFSNQVEYAGAIILSRTDKAQPEKVEESYQILRELNEKAPIITTPIAELPGDKLLETMEHSKTLEEELLAEIMCPECGGHHEHGESCGCGHDHHHEGQGCCHEGDGHHHEEEGHSHGECCGHHHEEHGHSHGECCGHHHEEHEHSHEEHADSCGCGHDHHHHDHGHHHADEVFSSWGRETIKTYTKEEIEHILKALESDESFGVILRAKGMVAGENDWIYFDMVPGEHEVRSGAAEYTGRLCVIGSNLNEGKLGDLFGIK